jgi:xanthine dehydrogenase accessory factor
MCDITTPGAGEADPWSVTTHDLQAAMRRYRAEGTETVLATIVDVEGSAYRRPGAKMLIDPAGDSFGAITAGCLEGPVTELAGDVVDSGAPVLETFDLMDDEGWGLGLGCNGIIDILLEPLDDTWDAPLAELEAHRAVATVSVIDSSDEAVAVGDRVVLDDDLAPLPDGDRNGLPAGVVEAVEPTVADLQADRNSTAVTVETADGEVTAFVDWVTPAPTLLLFGTQNDVHPVARMGHEAGFRVVVASARGARSDPEQFPNAHEVRSTKPMAVGEVVEDPERTYAVVMSHNALEDRLALASLLDTAVPYVGLMGPRERFEEIREDLATEEDRTLTEAELERVSTPVGLDLGGGEPTQIALSIAAEALAVHNDREGGRLKAREGPIHTRVTPAE